jgi:long-chain fatty acid transport protein
MRAAVVLLALLALLVPGAPARANPLSTFGFGARATAMAGAQAADARGPAAAHHNAAGVAFAEGPEVLVGYGGAVMGLTLDGAAARVTAPRGTSLGLALPARFQSFAVALGVALYIPDQFLLRVRLVPPGEPRFLLLDNNLQRLAVEPVLSLRVGRRFALGAGATLLADAAGRGVTFDVGVVGGDKIGRGAIDVALPLRAAPLVGILALPAAWLRLGATYRGALDLRLSLDVLARIDIAGAITGDALIALRAADFYTPHEVTLAAAIDPLPWVTLTAEVRWLGWHLFDGGVPDLRVGLDLSVSPPLVDGRARSAPFSDVWSPRLGVEVRRELTPRFGLDLRAGYAFVPSPMPPQSGQTSYADCDRHVVAAGGGLRIRRLAPILRGPISVGVALQLHELVARVEAKAPSRAGRGFVADGWILALAATLEARF